MKEKMKNNGLIISGLMTGSQAPFYEKYGYFSIPIHYSLIQIDKKENFTKNFKFRQVNWEKDLEQIKKIYTQFCNTYKLQGSFTRKSDEYWINWVKAEIGNSLVAERDSEVLALVSWKERKESLVLCEFNCSCEKIKEEERGELLYEMLQYSIFQNTQFQNENQIKLLAYKFAATLMKRESLEEKSDNGSMYFILNPPSFQKQTELPSDLHSLLKLFENNHLVWFTDRY